MRSIGRSPTSSGAGSRFRTSTRSPSRARSSAPSIGCGTRRNKMFRRGGPMIRKAFIASAACLALATAFVTAQTRTVPRPPAQPPGQQPPGESAAPDGYQPLPLWLAQTRAPVPAKIEAFTVETFAQGVNGAAFKFLPDGRILLGERNGRIRIVGPDG